MPFLRRKLTLPSGCYFISALALHFLLHFLLLVVINFGGSCQQQQQKQPFSPQSSAATSAATLSSLVDTATADYSVADYSVNSPANDFIFLSIAHCPHGSSSGQQQQQQQQQKQLSESDRTMAPAAKPVIFIIGGPGSGECGWLLCVPNRDLTSFSSLSPGKGTICDRLKAK